MAQEAVGLTTQPENMQTMKWVIPDFTLQTKLTLRRHQGSRSQINWHGSMNPLVSEMLDAFRILDPSDGAKHWIPWLPEMLELPSGVPTDPRTK